MYNTEPMKTIEALVMSGRLHHPDDPIFNWCVSNVVCHRDAKDNIYPNKLRNENKIDLVVALIMAFYSFLIGGGKIGDRFGQPGHIGDHARGIGAVKLGPFGRIGLGQRAMDDRRS